MERIQAYRSKNVKPNSIWRDKHTGLYIQVVLTAWDIFIPEHERVGKVYAVDEYVNYVSTTVPELFAKYDFMHQYPEFSR